MIVHMARVVPGIQWVLGECHIPFRVGRVEILSAL